MLSDLLDGRAVEDDPVTADGADPRRCMVENRA